MRAILTISLLLVVLTTEARVSIRGRIRNYDGKSGIVYSPTLEGIHTPYWKEILPAADGTFLIEFDNRGYGTTRIFFSRVRFTFFHDAASRIYFEIDQEKINHPGLDKLGYVARDSIRQQAIVKISGDYEPINRFYNSQLRTIYFHANTVGGNYYSRTIAKATTPSQAMTALDSLAQIEIDRIALLTPVFNPEKDEKRNKEVTDFLTNEVKAFYAGAFMNALFLKRVKQAEILRKDSTAQLDLYGREWEDAFEQFSEKALVEIKPAANSVDYNEYMETMVVTRLGYKLSTPRKPRPLDEGVREDLLNVDTILFADNKARFAYILWGLHVKLNDQLFYSPALLNAVYDLQKQYPGSVHLAFFDPKIEKLKRSIDAGSKSFDEGKIINKQYSSLNKLLEQFAGQNILIDVWATWCGPCVQDFAHKDKIKPFIENNQIEVLYISIDRPEWEDRWKQSIKFNALTGNHFRADKKFIEDMWAVLGEPVGQIPRYALVNKAGQIVVPGASRPGSEALTAEINDLLKGN